MNTQHTTGDRISALRRRLGLTQPQFAAALGVPLSTLSKWEVGTRIPSGAAATLIHLLEQHPHLVHSTLLPQAEK